MRAIFNRTKIIATVGPACDSRENLMALVAAGVDVFRLNFSHGSHEEHLRRIRLIQEINSTFGSTVSILQDLQGPKIRIGKVEEGAVLKEGEKLVITTEEIVGTAARVSTAYKSLPQDVKKGEHILIDDGKLSVMVEDVIGNEVHTRVVVGGKLLSKKGMNLPDTDISEPALTKKDKEDLVFGLENGADWIALSFVRTAGDIQNVKDIIKSLGKQARVIAKIERPEALRNIDAIIEASDAIMVARGDLGVEIATEDVPMEQKIIVRKCNLAAKPVIVATQMMESMTDSARPTRAEANDVANAVTDGADAVMLSGETASGKYPVLTVQTMNRIVRSVERRADIYNKYYEISSRDPEFMSEVIVENACRMAKSTNAKAIIGMTFSGFTAFRIARHRPEANIFIFTANKSLISALNLVWGVRAFYYAKFESTDRTFKDIEDILLKEGFLSKGDVYINTASMPLAERRRTNVVKLSIADSE